jgi:hypothetical protein
MHVASRFYTLAAPMSQEDSHLQLWASEVVQQGHVVKREAEEQAIPHIAKHCLTTSQPHITAV